MARKKSLKRFILARLIVPLMFFITGESVLSYFVTLHYVDKTYDRWLLDTATALSQEIKITGADTRVELPPAAQEIVKWDDLDKTYFKINSLDKGLLAGDNIVPDAPPETIDQTNPVFFNGVIQGEPVRLLSMRIDKSETHQTFFVHVGETLNKRREMMRDILLADLLPQLFLMLLTSLMLLAGVKRGLKPLHALAGEIAKRSPHDLSPIAETHVFSEIRTLTDTINGLLQRLKESITAQQRFIANAAHQLRTPLAGFVVQTERAARENDLQTMKPALDQMQQSAHRLSHTVAQLLVLAKAEPVDGMNEFKRIDLARLVKSVCIEWVPKAMKRNIDISFESTENSVMIRGDETLLHELVINLLDNAVTYGADQGHVWVTLTNESNPVLTIEDDGPGIPGHERNKIFERFYRIPGSPGSGCGLGLAIVKEIADLHNAEITLSLKNAGGGTRISLVFNGPNDIERTPISI